MPLYNDLEVRSRMAQQAMPRTSHGATEQSLPAETVRLEARPRLDYGDLAIEAARAGALGGALGGGAVRPVSRGAREFVDPEVPYYDAHTGRGGRGGRDLRLVQAPHGPPAPMFEYDHLGNVVGVYDTGMDDFDFRSPSPEGPVSRLELEAIEPSWRTKARSALKSGIKGMLNPASIAADALLGGAVGAGSALGGYAAGGGSPESAGLFTAPGPGYEGVVSPELIERIAEQKELEREAERQRLLEQYRASGYDLDPNTRLSDLR
jgi:hypothetical protein